MKWKHIYWLYLMIGLVGLLPIGLYGYHYLFNLDSTLSSNGQDWAAFGGMYYGMVIAGLTGFNIWLFNKREEGNAERDRAMKLSECLDYILEISNDCREVVKNPTFERSKKIWNRIIVFYDGKLSLFQSDMVQKTFGDFLTNYRTFHYYYVEPHSIAVNSLKHVNDVLKDKEIDQNDYRLSVMLRDQLVMDYLHTIRHMQVEIYEKFHS